jgi:hypothetical protein
LGIMAEFELFCTGAHWPSKVCSRCNQYGYGFEANARATSTASSVACSITRSGGTHLGSSMRSERSMW